MPSAPCMCQSNVRATASLLTAFAATKYTLHDASYIPKVRATCARVPRPSLSFSVGGGWCVRLGASVPVQPQEHHRQKVEYLFTIQLKALYHVSVLTGASLSEPHTNRYDVKNAMVMYVRMHVSTIHRPRVLHAHARTCIMSMSST